jgi:small-conductance mechanosensitive channel
MRPVRGTLRAGFALLPLVLLPGTAFGQVSLLPEAGQQAESPDPVEAQVSPSAIPLQLVPRRLEQDMERIRQVETDVQRDAGDERTRVDLGQFLSSVDAVLDNFESRSLAELRPAELNNYRASLERELVRLSARTERLQRRFAQLESDQLTLDRIRLEWALTSDSLGLDTLATPSFEAGIRRVIEAADAAQADLDSVVLRLLETGEDLASSSSRVEAALASIGNMEELHRRMLLVRDAPPLWNPVEVLGEGRPLVGAVGRTVTNEVEVFGESLRADRDKILLHMLLFAFVLFLLLWLRGASLEWPEDQRLANTQFLLARPYSAAILTALLATNWIYPHASVQVFDLVLVLTLIPAARLLRPMVPAERRSSLYGILSLFLFSRLVALVPSASLSHRLALLGLAIGAAVWTAVESRKFKAGESQLIRGRLTGPYLLAVRIGFVLSVLSAMLNVAGWVELAELIIQGLIPSAYTAVVVALGAMILIAVVQGIALSPLLNRSRAFSENRDRVVGVSSMLIRFMALVIWLRAVIAWFGVDRQILVRVREVLTHEFSIGAVEISIGSVLLFILIIWLASWIGRIVRTLLRDDVLSRMSVSTGQADAWATLAQWGILIAGILFAAASAGIAGGQLAVLAGALGVGIGFGLQNIVNNFVSGFILIFEQPIKVGDKIEISSLSLLGEVRRIGVRSSTIRTFDGADVVVPNSNLIQSEVINWTLSDSKRRFEVVVGVKYGTDPTRVIELLKSVAADLPRVLRYPEPMVLFTGFGDSSLNFVVRAWSATFDESIALRSELAVAVNDALKAEGIEIPFPQRDLHVRSVAPEAREGARADSGIEPAQEQAAGPSPMGEGGS